MSLKDRIGKLEGGLHGGCPTCIGWPPRVFYVNDPEMAEGQPWLVPERCPRCGCEPLTIEVEYVDSPLSAA